MSRTLHVILNPTEVIDLLDEWQNLENDAELAATNCDRMNSRQIANEVSSQIQANSHEQTHKLNQILADLQAPILRIDPRVAALCQRLDNSERRDILRWI